MLSHGTPLFNYNNSFKAIDIASCLNIGIVGVEGFCFDGNKLMPIMDLIGDFSIYFQDDGNTKY